MKHVESPEQASEDSGRPLHPVLAFILFAAISTGLGMLYRSVGTRGAENTFAAEVAREAETAGVSLDALGVRWLASREDVIAAYPSAYDPADDELLATDSLYARPVMIVFRFGEVGLVGVVVTFLDEATPAAFDATAPLIARDFGAPRNGQFTVRHQVVESGYGSEVEQLIVYRFGAPSAPGS